MSDWIERGETIRARFEQTGIITKEEKQELSACFAEGWDYLKPYVVLTMHHVNDMRLKIFLALPAPKEA